MTPDQKTKLSAISERLADVVITDADPDNWAAPGTTLGKMTSQQRGDAAWCRKAATQSVALLIRVRQLLRDEQPSPGDVDDIDAEVRAAEAKAREMVDRVMERHAARG